MLRAGPPSWAFDVCSHMGACAQKDLTLGFIFCSRHLGILIFWTRDLTFPFCTGPYKLCNWFCLRGCTRDILSSGKPLLGPQERVGCSSGPIRNLSFPSNETSQATGQSPRRLSVLWGFPLPASTTPSTVPGATRITDFGRYFWNELQPLECTMYF